MGNSPSFEHTLKNIRVLTMREREFRWPVKDIRRELAAH